MSTEQQVDDVAEHKEPSDFLIPLGGGAKATDTGPLDVPVSESFFSRSGDGDEKVDRPNPTELDVVVKAAGDLNVGHRNTVHRTPGHNKETKHDPGSGALSGKVREARRVQRVVSQVDVWSLVKVSALFYICLWVVLMVAGMILWRVASSLGLIGNIENFVAEMLAEETVNIDGTKVFRAYLLAGAVLVVTTTAFTGLLAVMFNLITTVTGGVKIRVIEMETARPKVTRNGRRGRSGS